MEDRIDKLVGLANGLLEIPASEQFIGHMQVAVKESLLLIAEELKYLRRRGMPLN